MTGRTRRCDEATAAGRLRKAEQFLDAAHTVREAAPDEAEVGDAVVALCVAAGIAAADAICCLALGEHAMGESHDEAVALLEKVRPEGKELARALSALLAMKTKASYSDRPVGAEQRRRAERSATRLLDAAHTRRRNGIGSPGST